MEQLNVNGTIHHIYDKDDTIKVKLEKGQKGTYAWEITYEAEGTPSVIARIKEADTMLREGFGNDEPGKKEG